MPTRQPNRLPVKEIYKSNNSFFVTVCVEGRKEILGEIINTVGAGSVPPVVSSENESSCETGNTEISPTDFGIVKASPTIKLTFAGKIVEQTWLNLPNIFTNIVLDEFVVMPNHFHGIITFLDRPISKFTGKESDLGKVIKRFKLETLRNIVASVTDGHLQNLNVDEKEILQRRSVIAPTVDLKRHNGELKFAPTMETRDNVEITPTEEGIVFLLQKHKTIWQKSFWDHVIRDEKDLQRIQEYIQFNPLNWSLDELNPKKLVGETSVIQKSVGGTSVFPVGFKNTISTKTTGGTEPAPTVKNQNTRRSEIAPTKNTKTKERINIPLRNNN